VALNGHEVLLGSDTQSGNAIRGHEREFRDVFVGFEDRCNNDQEDFAGRVGRVVRRGAKFAKTIPQEAGDGHMWDANGEVDMIAGILRYHNIC